MRLEASVVQRRSIDVVYGANASLLEDQEACSFHLVVVAGLQITHTTCTY